MLDARLLERLRELNPEKDLSGFNMLDYIYAEGSPLEALVYSRLFWVDFIEINDMVFLKEAVEDEGDLKRLSQALESYGGDRQKTERSLNFYDINSLFGRRVGETTDEEDGRLLERLAQMWHCRLHQVFPERTFLVQVLNAQQSGDQAGIVFYQQQPNGHLEKASSDLR